MKEVILPATFLRENHKEKEKRTDYANRWKSVLIFSILTAVTLAGTGLIISGLAYLGLPENAKAMSRIGTILIAAAAPLFFLAAHSLDELKFLERKNKFSDE